MQLQRGMAIWWIPVYIVTAKAVSAYKQQETYATDEYQGS
jgi:hypothetical protein